MPHSVAVVTGGCGETGLRSAKLLAREHHVVLSDSSRERLHRALDQLDSAGVSAESIVADPADRRSVETLMSAAREAGPIATVVHAAGVVGSSPAEILRGHVLGTVNVTAATLAVAAPGTTLIHATRDAGAGPWVSAVPRRLLARASTNPEAVVRALTRLAELGPVRLAPTIAQGLSTTFLDWYAAHMAAAFRARGARLHAVGPLDLAPVAESYEPLAS